MCQGKEKLYNHCVHTLCGTQHGTLKRLLVSQDKKLYFCGKPPDVSTADLLGSGTPCTLPALHVLLRALPLQAPVHTHTPLSSSERVPTVVEGVLTNKDK